MASNRCLGGGTVEEVKARPVFHCQDIPTPPADIVAVHTTQARRDDSDDRTPSGKDI